MAATLELYLGWWNTYLRATNQVLGEIDQLRGVADLVIAIGEHWDGSGTPDHLLQGQIPLRSRILRTLIDLFRDCVEGSVPSKDAFDKLNRFAGTRYDPLVVSHVISEFAEQSGKGWLPDSRHIPLGDLSAGMVLAKDLTTGSGVKLLTQGATVTDSTLDLIMQRRALVCGFL